MKIFGFFICIYFTILTALPTVRLIKIHLHKKCQSSFVKSNSKNNANNGCQKEKCIIDLTFNSSAFLNMNQNYSFKTSFIPFKIIEKSECHKIFIPQYSATIWQPPENIFLIS